MAMTRKVIEQPKDTIEWLPKEKKKQSNTCIMSSLFISLHFVTIMDIFKENNI